MLTETNFSGAFLGIHQAEHTSYERMYHAYTHHLPCFYKITQVAAGKACLQFQLDFQQLIRDYMVLDVVKVTSKRYQYVLCYVLDNDIFVIFDEATATIKILYHNAKDPGLSHIIQHCMNFK